MCGCKFNFCQLKISPLHCQELNCFKFLIQTLEITYSLITFYCIIFFLKIWNWKENEKICYLYAQGFLVLGTHNSSSLAAHVCQYCIFECQMENDPNSNHNQNCVDIVQIMSNHFHHPIMKISTKGSFLL